MRVLALLCLIAACDQGARETPKPPSPGPLDGDIACGKHTCHSNQVCVVEQAGHTCWRDRPDIGEYGIHDQRCIDLPAACHGVPACECATGWNPPLCRVDGRTITEMCL